MNKISLVTFRGDLREFNYGGALCPNCGFEYTNYLETRHLGCSKCYDAFHDNIKRELANA